MSTAKSIGLLNLPMNNHLHMRLKLHLKWLLKWSKKLLVPWKKLEKKKRKYWQCVAFACCKELMLRICITWCETATSNWVSDRETRARGWIVRVKGHIARVLLLQILQSREGSRVSIIIKGKMEDCLLIDYQIWYHLQHRKIDHKQKV